MFHTRPAIFGPAFASARCHCSLRNLLCSEACCIFLSAAAEQMMRPILLNLFPLLCRCQLALLLSEHPQPWLWQKKEKKKKKNVPVSRFNVTWSRRKGVRVVRGQAVWGNIFRLRGQRQNLTSCSVLSFSIWAWPLSKQFHCKGGRETPF